MLPNRPFIVYSMPRSRSAWLSEFLTYGDWTCYHERAILMRNIAQVVGFFRLPRTGTVETAAAPGWQLLEYYVPGLKTVVVRRRVPEVIDSFMRLDVSGIAAYDRALLIQNMNRIAAALDVIASGADVLTVDHDDLNDEGACKAIFEHCLPYQHDGRWWAHMRGQNIQADVAGVLRYYFDNRKEIDAFKTACRAEMRALVHAGVLGRRRST